MWRYSVEVASTKPSELKRRVSDGREPEQKGIPSMLFRDHPLFTFKNTRSWPPNWLYCGGFDNTHPQGEVGILKNVFVSSVKPSNRCFLIMEHAGAEYIGDLLVSDDAFCTQIYEMLLGYCGKTIQEIGDIALSAIQRKKEGSISATPKPRTHAVSWRS